MKNAVAKLLHLDGVVAAAALAARRLRRRHAVARIEDGIDLALDVAVAVVVSRLPQRLLSPAVRDVVGHEGGDYLRVANALGLHHIEFLDAVVAHEVEDADLKEPRYRNRQGHRERGLMAFLFRCPECRTRRRSYGLFTQHLRETGHPITAHRSATHGSTSRAARGRSCNGGEPNTAAPSRQSYWTQQLIARLAYYRREGETRFVVTDVRFDNEAHALRMASAVLWQVIRPGHYGAAEGAHVSATDGSRFNPEAIIANARDVKHLQVEVLSLFIARELGLDRGRMSLTLEDEAC
ncbi:hypothetical protein FQZ97_635610 [compost metagenome]